MLIAADRAHSSRRAMAPFDRRHKGIHELFEEQVENAPEAVAIVFGNQQWTYRELNARANNIAHHLRSLGVGPEALVGICVERSLEMMAGLLGILKAGGAYVPMDPAYPKERIAFMMKDAAVNVLLTDSHCVQELPFHQASLVLLDTTFPDCDTENLTTTIEKDNAAYVIYTSGSTGKPKGVVIEHRNVIALTHGMRPLLSAQELARRPGINFDLLRFVDFRTICHACSRR